ncbi:MAG TPA: bifunctional pyr operon transcriptional regulator/uracil phosphoribosyltransferase PyrR [Candidatus Competibacteraceae bacterium]|nr:bifunctional pyr operon transcriptional regulator/uracil phosphoribosyltransferase PyrR [Candidatus Competibacteraceae bacterium]
MLDTQALLHTLSERVRALLAERAVVDPALVGIHTGGVWVAEYLHRALGLTTPLGRLDIAFHRDDFGRIGMHARVHPSELPFDVDGRHIVLVDDVLYTGRSVRAALDNLFAYGRPASVLLAVLVDRGGRELPIQPDAVATRIELAPGESVKLSGPEPLQLVLLPHKP